MSPTTARLATRPRSRADWLIPSGLVLFSLAPALAGASRMAELAGDPAITEENARFVESPMPILVHLVAVTIYSLLGAFQFSPGFRRRRNGWHRIAGAVLIPAGLGTALTGMWMTAFYDLPSKDTAVVNGARYVVGIVMVTGILLSVRALLRHDYVTHGAWMTRAYALALGAGTQTLLLGPWLAVARPQPDDPAMPVVFTILMTLSWAINAVVAEWVIRRRRRPGRIAR